jgi:hypothetical protein
MTSFEFWRLTTDKIEFWRLNADKFVFWRLNADKLFLAPVTEKLGQQS